MSEMRFEWNRNKERQNRAKHKVSFAEARTVFYDEFALEFHDEENAAQEYRFIMLGMSSSLRILVVCHCLREKGNTIRIISARKATKKEKEYYSENRP